MFNYFHKLGVIYYLSALGYSVNLELVIHNVGGRISEDRTNTARTPLGYRGGIREVDTSGKALCSSYGPVRVID